MPYRFLADAVLVLHLGVVVFILVGLGLVLVGNLRGWGWVNAWWFRLAHLTAIGIVVLQAWLGRVCPLTTLESWLRMRAGAPTYSGTFVEHWVQRVLYYEAPVWLFTLAYTVFGVLVLAAWWYFPPRRKRTGTAVKAAKFMGLLCAAGLGVAMPAPLLADVESARQQVFTAERAFARSMAERKLEAFGTHVADDAIFFGGKDVQRGKAQVIAAWSGFFDGEQPPFSWDPDQVEVLESGTLALSTGVVRDPAGKVIGRFNSIWRLEAPGTWRVVFDKGSPPEPGDTERRESP